MTTRNFTRRDLLKLTAAASAVGTLGACATGGGSKGKVVVVGGGWGGATAAKYTRMWSEGTIDVTLVEPSRTFVSCPISNLVLGGSRKLDELTMSYDGLRRHGVNVVHDTVTAIDADRKQVRLASGGTLPFDRAVVSPGIEFMYEQVKGMSAQATETLLVLDANPQVTSKGPLFTRVWNEDYAGIVDYQANMAVSEVDVKGRTYVTNLGDRIKGDVLNLILPQRAGDIARDAGLITANNRWCEVDWISTESVKVKNVHVIGDATFSAPTMPKSGHMANQHGKAAAAAIVEMMNGRPAVPPVMANTCYSYVDDRNAIHVASVHQWDAAKKTMLPVAGSGGVSGPDRAQWALEGQYAWGWAQTVWADMLA